MTSRPKHGNAAIPHKLSISISIANICYTIVVLEPDAPNLGDTFSWYVAKKFKFPQPPLEERFLGDSLGTIGNGST